MADILGGFSRMVGGLRNGLFPEPGLVEAEGRNKVRWDFYRRNQEFYRNTAFEDLDAWAQYMSDRGMYEETRLIYNPFKRLVEWNVGRIYPGRITADGKRLPFEVRNAIPFSDNMSDGMKAAAVQIYEWSNWQVKKGVWIRFTSVMGNSLLEVVDDARAGKVRLNARPSTQLKHFELNDAGNLEMYELEYPAINGNGDVYTYGRRVTRAGVTEFADNEQTSFTPTEYGFVPAVLTFHKDVGDDFGADAFDGDYVKLEEANSVATHGLDNLHKNIDPAIIIFSDSRIQNALKTAADAKAGTGEFVDDPKYQSKTDFRVLRAGMGGDVKPMVGRLASSEVLDQIKSIIENLEKDHPQLTFYDKLREMQYVSGPGGRAMFGDVEAIYNEICANYDAALERATEMAMAIAGQRLKDRQMGWAQPSEKQQRVAGWDLDSFAKDRLNVEIMTRPLLPWTIDDETEVKKKRAEVAVVVGDFTSKRFQLAEYGVTDKAEQDKILKQMATEDMDLVEATSEAQNAGSPQATDPNLTGNKTTTARNKQE